MLNKYKLILIAKEILKGISQTLSVFLKDVHSW